MMRDLEALLAEAGLRPVDVVKVAHHGSSCGRANRFGFPAPEVLDRWRAAGADVARTDLDGAVTVTIDAAGRLSVDRFAH